MQFNSSDTVFAELPFQHCWNIRGLLSAQAAFAHRENRCGFVPHPFNTRSTPCVLRFAHYVERGPALALATNVALDASEASRRQLPVAPRGLRARSPSSRPLRVALTSPSLLRLGMTFTGI